MATTSFDWTGLWNTAIKFLQGFTDANKASTPPAVTGQGADAAIAALQDFLNQLAQMGLLQLDAKLKVDGWIGPKTDAAIMAAIARLKGMLGTP